MTLHELIWKLEDLTFETDGDPEVFVQVAGFQWPLCGIKLFPEVKDIVSECVVVADCKDPKLII